jgi:hypothetical protein
MGGLVPRAADSYGVHVKLATYALDPTNEVATSKVRGFERILGITLEDIDYLEGTCSTGSSSRHWPSSAGWAGIQSHPPNPRTSPPEGPSGLSANSPLRYAPCERENRPKLGVAFLE